MPGLQNIKISGFKSIRDLGPDGLALNRINILIGENGAGKSNLVSFFKLLNFMLTDGLQIWIGRSGGASSLLHYGPKVSPIISAAIQFETSKGLNEYAMDLAYAAGDKLIFTNEIIKFRSFESTKEKPYEASLGAGQSESLLRDVAYGTGAKSSTAKVIRRLLETTKVFHFHDTSETARIKEHAYIEDSRFLRSDAGNLAARLFALKTSHVKHYLRIVSMIQQIAPFFGDFILEPSSTNKKSILLQWSERGSDQLFGPHQLSDGTLRFMALATLLLQPAADLPDVIIVDEPELGLHPAAISVLGAMVHTASEKSQILMTTQSPKLLDEFDPQDIIVTSRIQSSRRGQFESKFERLEPEPLKAWLADYCLSDLWDKNVLGGRPSR